jgi:Domain of unknown function (DUF4347)
MGVEVNVVDDSDIVGWAASATRTNEVYMTSVSTMVDNVIQALQDMRPYRLACTPVPYTPVCVPGLTRGPAPRMSRLNVLDHGNSSRIQFGDDRVDIGNLATFQPTLQRLRGYFDSDGFVHLQHCDAGQNETLLVRLAQIFGVSVYAGTGAHNPVYRFNWGEYVRADPDGTFNKDVARP